MDDGFTEFESTSVDAGSVRARLVAASNAALEGNFALTRELGLTALDEHPGHASAMRLLARMATQTRDEDLLKRLLEESDEPDANTLGICAALVSLGQPALVARYIKWHPHAASLRRSEEAPTLLETVVRALRKGVRLDGDPSFSAEAIAAIRTIAPDDPVVDRLLPRLVRADLARLRTAGRHDGWPVAERLNLLSPGHEEATLWLVDASIERGRGELALEWLSRLSDGVIGQPRMVDLVLRSIAATSSDLRRAVEINRWGARLPMEASDRLLRAARADLKSRSNANDHASASLLASAILQRSPGDREAERAFATAQAHVGRALRERMGYGDMVSAATFWDVAEKGSLEEPVVRRAMHAFQALGDDSRAAAAAQVLIERGFEQEARTCLARMAHRAGDYATSRDHASRGLASAPDDATLRRIFDYARVRT